MKPSFWKTLLAVAILLLAAGCASFERPWQRELQQAKPATDLTGAWIGTWQNTNNSHGGSLRALVTRVDAATYRTRFHATWGSHSGSFRTVLRGHEENGDFVFTGSKHILGFRITNTGRANPTNFLSTYESRFDTGTFTLKRP